MQPALTRDRDASHVFFHAGPRRTRSLRLRHGVTTTPVDAEAYRQLLTADVTTAIGIVAPPNPAVEAT